MLLGYFDVDLTKLPTTEHPHRCSDIGHEICKCQGDCNFVFFPAQSSDIPEASMEHSLYKE